MGRRRRWQLNRLRGIWQVLVGTPEGDRAMSAPAPGLAVPDGRSDGTGDGVAPGPAARHPGVAPTALQAETEFELPRGFVDGDGTVHREGRMRLATARDELAPLVDSRVARNRAYLVVILLARVVTRLGSLPDVTPEVIEGLHPADFGYLQQLYRQLNMDPLAERQSCPSCGASLPPGVGFLGGAPATPPG